MWGGLPGSLTAGRLSGWGPFSFRSLSADLWPSGKASVSVWFVLVLISVALFPDAQKRKSKWDSAIPVTTIAQPTILTTTATLPAVVTVTTSASGSKTTVISAVGTIVKKAKQ